MPIRERYGLVLILILTGYVLSGFDTSRWVSVLNALLWGALLFTTLWSPGVPKRIRRIGAAAIVVLLLTAIPLGLTSSDVALGVRLLLLAIAQLAALLAILSRILTHEKVRLQTVMGAIAGYALTAFVMAAIYHGFDVFTDGGFLNNVVSEGDYTYFSFVTLTTVGYGDITAASDLAKRLVVVEAFVGQVFLIVLVARLVALWGSPLKK
ncbi:MAG: potassium channel family protein [Acidimicrobiia bacterium]